MVNNGGAELWPQSAQLDPGEVTAGKLPHQTVHQNGTPDSVPEWNTRQCTRMEHQTEKTNGASDSAPQRNTRIVKFTKTEHQNNEVNQIENSS